MPTTVSAAFVELLSRLTLTDNQRETAEVHAKSVIQAVRDNFVLTTDGAWVTGSFSRRTMTRWQRDVDVIAVLSVPEYDATYGNNSREFLYFFRNKLNEEYGSTSVSSRQISVKLAFSDYDVDVVPCFLRQGGGFLIPDGRHGWKATNPRFHFTFMKAANLAHDNRLKPIVRLMKAWNIANGGHLSSIHVELMTERMWRDRNMGTDTPAAVASSIRAMASWLQDPFPDPWVPGDAIDYALPIADRNVAIRMLTEDGERAQVAEQLRAEGRPEKAFERWAVIYRNRFPAYG